MKLVNASYARPNPFNGTPIVKARFGETSQQEQIQIAEAVFSFLKDKANCTYMIRRMDAQAYSQGLIVRLNHTTVLKARMTTKGQAQQIITFVEPSPQDSWLDHLETSGLQL